MKKLFLKVILIVIAVITLILSLPFLLPTKMAIEYSDDTLRELAISSGLKPVPSSFDKLLELVDTTDNKMDLQKIALGQKLFFDIQLSKNKEISCATCHSFDKNLTRKGVLYSFLTSNQNNTTCVACHLGDQSGVDRFTFSLGDGQTPHPYLLNTQTILNTTFAKYFTWSGEVKSIKEQTANSLQSAHKMNLSQTQLEARLKENPTYQTQFQKVFGENINFENTTKAIEAYVKTLTTRGDYDRFLEGNNNAMSDEAKRGLKNFINFGCKGCHNGISLGGTSIQAFPLRNFASIYDLKPNFELVPEVKIFNNEFPFENKGGFLGKNNNHLFRVPSLRNVTKTSPYFHNGAVAKIREAVEIMAKHQIGRNLSETQIDEIVAFLRTLEGDIVDYASVKSKETK